MDELIWYLNTTILILENKAADDTFDLLEWWKGNAIEYPTLARIAFNVFSIPSMSVKPEWVFSEYVPITKKKLIEDAI